MKSLPLILALAFSTAAQAGVDIQRWTTGNGTEVLLVEQHDNPIVDMQVNFKGAGSVFNPEGKSEVAEFTAALLTDGTEKPLMPPPTTLPPKSTAAADRKALPPSCAA